MQFNVHTHFLELFLFPRSNVHFRSVLRKSRCNHLANTRPSSGNEDYEHISSAWRVRNLANTSQLTDFAINFEQRLETKICNAFRFMLRFFPSQEAISTYRMTWWLKRSWIMTDAGKRYLIKCAPDCGGVVRPQPLPVNLHPSGTEDPETHVLGGTTTMPWISTGYGWIQPSPAEDKTTT